MVWLILIVLFSISVASAATIHEIGIRDILNTDLSMKETIIINISNNTDKSFLLTFPDQAENIIANGTEINKTVSDEIACEQCVVEITYEFPGIIQNDSENFTFYRKIDIPTNTTNFVYSIELPANYTVENLSDTRASLFPTPARIIAEDALRFEWYYEEPEFPKEFAVRYHEMPEELEKFSDNYRYFPLLLVFVLIFLVLLIGLILGSRNVRRRKK